jgi:hypothetical protein
MAILFLEIYKKKKKKKKKKKTCGEKMKKTHKKTKMIATKKICFLPWHKTNSLGLFLTKHQDTNRKCSHLHRYYMMTKCQMEFPSAKRLGQKEEVHCIWKGTLHRPIRS